MSYSCSLINASAGLPALVILKILFTSAIAITGRYLANNKKHVKNKPNVPKRIRPSVNVGVYIAHEDGKKSLCNDVTIITKRSNHIPIFTNMEMMKMATGLLRILRDQNNCGVITLHEIMIQ